MAIGVILLDRDPARTRGTDGLDDLGTPVAFFVGLAQVSDEQHSRKLAGRAFRLLNYHLVSDNRHG